jgi:hypothetical protein
MHLVVDNLYLHFVCYGCLRQVQWEKDQRFDYSESLPIIMISLTVYGISFLLSLADQMHRNEAVLHSLVREWSSEGADERAAAFDPILAELARLLPVTAENAYKQRVLVPGIVSNNSLKNLLFLTPLTHTKGCGLARLPLEIASKGYICQANEFSVYMLMASHFILNGNA